MLEDVDGVVHGIMRNIMKRKEISELKAEQEALKGSDMQMEERFKAWHELQHKIDELEE